VGHGRDHDKPAPLSRFQTSYNFLNSAVDEVIVRFKTFALTISLLLIMSAFSESSIAQNPRQNPPPIPRLGNPGVTPESPEDEQRAKMEKEMAKKANRERQAQLQRDTDNLLKLANELKQSVDKSNENTLSLDVVKKAEEIEKLAHNVKEKMKAN
jgi:hypothetical protein